ncbi:hypothetical protein C8J57DRAFT_1714387 [Mycena rebaudengoi]|nr:hypothetical protein C8J57DRAFT_1714387 [Mycena rebaudengoi]
MFPTSTLLLGLAALTLGHAAPTLQVSCSVSFGASQSRVHPAKSYFCRDPVQNTQTQLDSGVYEIFSAATRGKLQSSSEYPDEPRVFVPNHDEYLGDPRKFGLWKLEWLPHTGLYTISNVGLGKFAFVDAQDQVAVGRSYPQSFIISPENDNFIIGTYDDNKLWSVTGTSMSLAGGDVGGNHVSDLVLVGGGYFRSEDRWGCVLGAFEENARRGTWDLELASEIEGADAVHVASRGRSVEPGAERRRVAATSTTNYGVLRTGTPSPAPLRVIDPSSHKRRSPLHDRRVRRNTYRTPTTIAHPPPRISPPRRESLIHPALPNPFHCLSLPPDLDIVINFISSYPERWPERQPSVLPNLFSGSRVRPLGGMRLAVKGISCNRSTGSPPSISTPPPALRRHSLPPHPNGAALGHSSLISLYLHGCVDRIHLGSGILVGAWSVRLGGTRDGWLVLARESRQTAVFVSGGFTSSVRFYRVFPPCPSSSSPTPGSAGILPGLLRLGLNGYMPKPFVDIPPIATTFPFLPARAPPPLAVDLNSFTPPAVLQLFAVMWRANPIRTQSLCAPLISLQLGESLDSSTMGSQYTFWGYMSSIGWSAVGGGM